MNVLLYGGGIDSTTLLVEMARARNKFVTLLVDYGQKAFPGELEAAHYFVGKYNHSTELKLGQVDLQNFSGASILHGSAGKSRKDNRLELRNVALISYAAVLCASNGGGSIYLGFHKENDHTFPDARTEWLIPMRRALSTATEVELSIDTPYQNLTREQIADLAQGMDRTILQKSYTCYEKPSGKNRWECGKCLHCMAKKKLLAGVLP